jgi:hypothetical protein
MVGRFKPRKAGDGPTSWGVWDGAANGWRGRDLTEDQAQALADDLELQYDAHGPRPAEMVRRVQPPIPIDRAVWQPGGILEAWIRQRGEWFGRIRQADGSASWVPAADLRPDRSPTHRA